MRDNSYSKINSFQLQHKFERWLFTDMFITNGHLVLISTFYPDVIIKYSDIDVLLHKADGLCVDKKLKLSKKFERNNPGPVRIIFYKIKAYSEVEIYVSYAGVSKRFHLVQETIEKKKQNSIAAATLFKNDYELIPQWINHHKKHGINYFYLYYNGRLNSAIRKYLPQEENIVVCDWDYSYWTEGIDIKNDFNPVVWDTLVLDKKAINNYHHAQPMFINSIVHKYSNQHDWILFTDLDEYISLKTKTALIDYLDGKKVTGFIIPNYFGYDKSNNFDYILRNENHTNASRTKVLCNPKKVQILNIHNIYKKKGKCLNYDEHDIYHVHLINKFHKDRINLISDRPVIDNIALINNVDLI